MSTVPFYENAVNAGFPSPAADEFQSGLDLNALVVKNPAATFFVRVQGDSMKEAGIFSGDILTVDRSISPRDDRIVVAVVNGEFTVKRLSLEQGSIRLVAANENYPPILISPEMEFQIWGVVTYVIHQANSSS